MAALRLELLEVDDLAKVIVPLGRGQAGGVAIAVKAARRGADVAGVQARPRGVRRSLRRRGEPVSASSALTIADGIAVKARWAHARVVQRWLDDVLAVAEDEIAEAMALLVGTASSWSRRRAPSASLLLRGLAHGGTAPSTRNLALT